MNKKCNKGGPWSVEAEIIYWITNAGFQSDLQRVQRTLLYTLFIHVETCWFKMSYNQLNISFKWFYLYFKQHPNFLGHDVVLVSRCSDDGNLLYLGHSSLCDYRPPFTRLAFPLCVYTLRSNHISVNRFFDEVTRKYLQDNKCRIRRNIVPWFVSPLSYDSDLTKFQMCWLVRVGHWELLGKIYVPVKVVASLTVVFSGCHGDTSSSLFFWQKPSC